MHSLNVFFIAAALCAGVPAVSAQPGNPKSAAAKKASAAPEAAAKNEPNKPADPFADDTPGVIAPFDCHVRMEVFVLPQAAARRAQQMFGKQADLYNWLELEMAKPASTVVLERMDVLRIRVGQRARLEGVDEYPFPTEYDPPQIPQTIGIGMPATVRSADGVPVLPPPVPGNTSAPASAPALPPSPQATPGPAAPVAPDKFQESPIVPSALPKTGPAGSVPANRTVPPWPYNPAAPTAFATKQTGWTLEAELTVEEDGNTVNLNLVPTFCRPAGEENMTLNGEIRQTVFESRQFSGQVSAPMGVPAFAGTFNRPVNTGAGGAAVMDATRFLFFTTTPAAWRNAAASEAFDEEDAPGAAQASLKEVLLRFEAFSLPLAAARQALVTHPQQMDLYAWLDKELDQQGSAVVLEHASTQRVCDGRQTKSQSLVEFSYPTEINPSQSPQTISLPVGAASTAIPGTESIFMPWPFTSMCVSSMGTKNLGWSSEVAVSLSGKAAFVDINMQPELVRIVAKLPFGANKDIWQPVFEVQRCSAQVFTPLRQPALVGTFTPPTGTGIQGANNSDRVWLLFTTATLAE
jgi:hypothetical protein